MIGIILWALLIIFIVICTCPGYLTFLFCVALPVSIGIYALFAWIDDKINK